MSSSSTAPLDSVAERLIGVGRTDLGEQNRSAHRAAYTVCTSAGAPACSRPCT